ncbi:MAG: carboxypeptidase-like regulatory domain-containing protein [Bacteroidia bacterium]
MNTQNQKPSFNFAQYDMLTLCTEQMLSPENQPKTDLIPVFKSGIENVKSKLDAVNLLLAPGKENTTGTAKKKRELKNVLALKMFVVSEPFAGFADSINNPELFTAFSKPISTYKRMRPAAIISQADYIIATVSPFLSQLEGTTINQQALDKIIHARDAFAPYSTMPRSKVVSKHVKLIQMETLLDEAMNITRRQLDKFAVGFIDLGLESFYNQWLRLRKLTPYGTLTTRASVNVYMGDANAPVTNATVSVDNTPLKGTTNDKGHAVISRVPFKQEHFITVTAPGFPNPVKAGPFSFKKGKATRITINMNEFNIPGIVKTSNEVNA